MLSRPYVRSYSGEKGRQFLQDPWIITLEKYVLTFFMVSISATPSVKYWQNFAKVLDTAKEKIHKNAGLVIHVLRQLETIRENFQKISIM